jgi:hypothetical protein
VEAKFFYVLLYKISEELSLIVKTAGKGKVNRNAITILDFGQDSRIISLSKSAKDLFQVCKVRTWVLHLIENLGLCQHSRP